MQTTPKLPVPARPCRADHITWHPIGGQCLNCGGTGPSCFQVKHAEQPTYHGQWGFYAR